MMADLFQANDIKRLVGIKTQRLNKLIESPGYKIGPSVRQSAGKGAPRLYSLDDVLRIALAWWLFQGGLRSQVIGDALETKGLMKELRESKHWSGTAQDRFFLVKRELARNEPPPREIKLVTLNELLNELQTTRQHSIQVVPLGSLVTKLWERLQNMGSGGK